MQDSGSCDSGFESQCPDKFMRINHYLAQQLQGGSRRGADRLIEEGRVKVNGKLAALGQTIDPAKDKITVEGRSVTKVKPQQVTIALYKPAGVVSARKDEYNRPTIMEYLPKEFHHLKPVGRLDFESEGLILMTSDGALINQMTHPKYEKEKVYRLRLAQPVTERLMNRFTKGIELKEGLAKADRVEKVGRNDLEVVLHQGWNRQLRRMAEACNNTVTRLVRVQFGPVVLGGLEPGKWKKVNIEK